MNPEEQLIAAIAMLLDEVEDDLGRGLDEEERDSVLDEFLAGLDDEEGPEPAPQPGPTPPAALAANEEFSAEELYRRYRGLAEEMLS